MHHDEAGQLLQAAADPVLLAYWVGCAAQKVTARPIPLNGWSTRCASSSLMLTR